MTANDAQTAPAVPAASTPISDADRMWLDRFLNGPGARWDNQMQILADLTAFVKAHGPKSKTPLPVLPWALSDTRSVSAEFWADSDQTLADPAAVVAAYAAVLGSEVRMQRFERDLLRGSGTRYYTEGRFGVPAGTDKQPRTKMFVTTFVPDHDQEQQGDR